MMIKQEKIRLTGDTSKKLNDEKTRLDFSVT